MKRKLGSAGVLLATALALGACGSSSSEGGGSSTGPINIGAPSDESGTYALIANIWAQGQTAAVSDLNAHGGIMGRKVVVTKENTQSNPSQASQVTSQMVRSKKYDVMMPNTPGTESGPTLEALNRSKVLSISGASLANAEDASVYPYAFLSSYSPTTLANAAACEVPTLGYKRVAILALNDSYSQGEVKAWEAKFKQLGITITGTQTMAFSDASATPQLQKLQGGDPEALMVVAYGPSVGVIFSGLKSIGWDPPFLGDISIATFPLSTVAKPGTYPSKVYGLGTEASTRQASGYTAQQQAAIDSLKSAAHVDKFVAALDAYAYGYDAVMLYAAGVEQAKSTDQDAVIKAMEAMNGDGPTTNVIVQPKPKYTAENHSLQDGEFSLVDMTSPFENGTWKAVKPIPAC